MTEDSRSIDTSKVTTLAGSSLVEKVAKRLKRRADSEHEQAVIRFIMVAAFVAYFSFETEAWAKTIRVYAATYFLVSFLYIGWIIAFPAANPVRRIVTMITDFAYASLLIHTGGEPVSIFFFLYPWVILGNGFRYGAKYLMASTVVASIGFIGAVLTTPFWTLHPSLAIGLLLGLIVVPIYAVTLIGRLTTARALAEEASQAKSRFLAVVSHELRTPLHGIIGMADLLFGTRLDDDQVEMAGTIRLSGQLLVSLIDSVLDFSRIEAGKATISVAEIDLHHSLAELITVLKPQAAAKSLALTVEMVGQVPPSIKVDWPHIRQILTNLIANAIKFTDSGQVAVRISIQHERLAFQVEDTGQGIPAAKLKDIFLPFVQAEDSANQRKRGSGLGLSIAQQLATLMGGTISVQSVVGRGSRFTFELACERGSFDPAVSFPIRVFIPTGQSSLPPEIAARVESQLAIDPDATTALWSRSDIANVLVVEVTEAKQIETLVLAAQSAGCPILAVGSWPDSWQPPLGRILWEAPVEDWTCLLHAALAFNTRSQPAPVPLERATAPLSVLGADDDLVNIKVLRRIMEKAGHRFHTVTSGDALLEEMNRGGYDVVISDVNMPGIPLTEVVALYKMGMPEHPIPVIALSADATPDTRKACLDAGVDGYLTKPTTQAVLLAAIGRLITPSEPRYLLAGPKVTDLSSHPLFQPSPMPTVDSHTVASLLALGGPECLYELLEDFMRDALLLIDAMQASAEVGDYVQFRNDRHALRSGAANLGARVVMNLCQPGPVDRGDLVDKGIPFCDRLRREISVFRQDVIAFAHKQKVVP